MSRQIFDFVVPTQTEDVPIEMPIGAKILCVDSERSRGGTMKIVFWAEVETEAKIVIRRFRTFKSRQEINRGYRYLGTAINEFEVLHLFEREVGFFFGSGV